MGIQGVKGGPFKAALRPRVRVRRSTCSFDAIDRRSLWERDLSPQGISLFRHRLPEPHSIVEGP